MTTDELEPCPFCGNANMDDDEGCFRVSEARGLWEVRCGNPSCFAHEPSAQSRDAAIKKWNTRTGSKP